jgi:hypothetical protein
MYIKRRQTSLLNIYAGCTVLNKTTFEERKSVEMIKLSSIARERET